MCVEIVQDHLDPLYIWEPDINQIFYLVSKVLFGPPWGEINVTPSGKRLENDKEIAGAFPFVFKIIP